MNLLVYENKEALAEATARNFADRAEQAIKSAGRFTVALAGGSTPKATYEILARDYAEDLDWSSLHFFFGDERTVPPDHEDSNYRMAKETLLDHISPGSVHRMRGEMLPDEAAMDYESELHEFFGSLGEPPNLDLIMLGLGEDGHTASLFPDTPALGVTDRWVAQNPVPKLETVRITLTLPVLNAARAVEFLVAGEGKAEALVEILEGNAEPSEYPAKLIDPTGDLTWQVDQAASSQLSEPRPRR